VEDPKKFQKIIVTPRGFEKTDVTANLERILKQGKVGHYEEAGEGTLTYEDIPNQIKLLAKDDEKKAVNLNAIKRIERRVRDWTREKRVERSTVVTEEFVDYLHKEAQDAVEKFKVWKSTALDRNHLVVVPYRMGDD